jgi:hypothetical protein
MPCFFWHSFVKQKLIRLFIRCWPSPPDVVDKLLGDVITEGLPGIIASVCGGDTGLIKRIIENEQLDEHVRGAALIIGHWVLDSERPL